MPVAFIFNAAVSMQPATGDGTDHIHETIEFFQSKGRESFSWSLTPALEESDWGNQLEAHGFRLETDLPGMAVDLNIIPQKIPVPKGYQIQQIEDSAYCWTSHAQLTRESGQVCPLASYRFDYVRLRFIVVVSSLITP